MQFFSTFLKEAIYSGILIFFIIILRIIVVKVVRRYAKSSEIIEHRSNLVIKYLHLIIYTMAFFALIIIWGVQKKDIFVTISSVTTIIGVAMFAQWSILSNITAGIILFFSFPFKIGDKIKVHDKDFPIEAEIIDINAFHTYLKTKEGEFITYPNNLLLQKGISIVREPQIEVKDFTD